MTFEEQVQATFGYAVTDQVNLCLRAGGTQRLRVKEGTRVYFRNLTNYTLHLRTSCEAGETDAGTAASNGLGQ